MPLIVSPCRADDLPILRGIARDPSLAVEFVIFQDDAGFDDLMADPFVLPELRWIARWDDQPVGFAFSFLAPSHEGSFAMVRIGVIDRFRRRGVGTALLAATGSSIEELRERHDVREVSVSAWEANPAAEAFALRHGFRFARNFWRMERPQGPVGTPSWPDGITMRTFDGGDRALEDFNDAYNRAFSSHYHYVRSSLEDTRVVTTQRHFRPDGLALAYRNGSCVGFCRNALFEPPGEVALIGTVPEARGIGLGRALLRWGVAWLQREQARPIYLMVDGENEAALRLYQSEGFEVVRTRVHWARPIVE
ncbi:MAG TPA: GNAT family N-acetyltransferase [Candidatus Eisenbacteria bacterium]|nr:GNAT family N-acetyltransferase [Candidatus Eisenbacteria bacterium]